MKIVGAAAIAISFGLAFVSLYLFLIDSLELGNVSFASDDAIEDHVMRRLLSSATSEIPSEDLSAYDYLIIHYHKTGHELAYSLTNLIKNDSRAEFKIKHDPLLKRDHDEITKCPHVELQLGFMYVQAAPDFFCDVHVLAEELLHGNHNKKGIKIVHLVRNPFRMAVSNYKYHSQDPTPERWVKEFDVCASMETQHRHYPDLLMPTLGWNGVTRYEDFDSMLDLCHSLFTTHPGLEKPDYYMHLLKLDPKKALQLATSQMMRGRNGDITRMANNIIKLQQLQEFEAQANIAQHHLFPSKRIQVMTLATEDFIQMPKETTIRFLDFLLGDNNLQDMKESIATEYEEHYLELVNKGNQVHITTGSSDNAMLESYLREHDLFGRILSNIEHVVDYALEDSK